MRFLQTSRVMHALPSDSQFSQSTSGNALTTESIMCNKDHDTPADSQDYTAPAQWLPWMSRCLKITASSYPQTRPDELHINNPCDACTIFKFRVVNASFRYCSWQSRYHEEDEKSPADQQKGRKGDNIQTTQCRPSGSLDISVPEHHGWYPQKKIKKLATNNPWCMQFLHEQDHNWTQSQSVTTAVQQTILAFIIRSKQPIKHYPSQSGSFRSVETPP